MAHIELVMAYMQARHCTLELGVILQVAGLCKNPCNVDVHAGMPKLGFASLLGFLPAG